MDYILHSIRFRQYFYVLALILLFLLLIIKYMVLPIINRREAEPKRFLRHVLDTLIALVISAMAIGALVFWIYGND